MEALIKAFHWKCLSTSAFTKAAGRKMLMSFEDLIQKEKQFPFAMSKLLEWYQ